MGFFDFLFTSITWNTAFEADPAGGDSPSFGDNEIRDLKQAVRERVTKEHTMDTSSGILTSDGYHRAGSAKDYYQAAAPTTRPDGVTSLDVNDNGRGWVRSSDNRLYIYVDPTWVAATALLAGDNTYSGTNNYTGTVQISGVDVLDVLYPVGYVYWQFPGKSSPETLWPDFTWTNISASYAGRFFRAEGGNAAAFDTVNTAGSNQAQDLQPHTHTTTVLGVKFSAGSGPDTGFYYESNVGDRSDSSKTYTSSSIGTTETRPINATIRLWERTA